VPVNAWSCGVTCDNAVVTVLGISVQRGFEPRPAGAPARDHCAVPFSTAGDRIRPGAATNPVSILFFLKKEKNQKKNFGAKLRFAYIFLGRTPED